MARNSLYKRSGISGDTAVSNIGADLVAAREGSGLTRDDIFFDTDNSILLVRWDANKRDYVENDIVWTYDNTRSPAIRYYRAARDILTPTDPDLTTSAGIWIRINADGGGGGGTGDNFYVTGGSVTGTTLTLTRQGLPDVTIPGLPSGGASVATGTGGVLDGGSRMTTNSRNDGGNRV